MGMGGVYLMGALEFLNAPGEFAIAGGSVYYRPYDAATPIEQLIIVASLPQRAVQFVAPSSAVSRKIIAGRSGLRFSTDSREDVADRRRCGTSRSGI